MPRSTLSSANETRDWRIFAAFAHIPIGIARRHHAGDPLGVELDGSLYALDSTTINLCLALFPWATFRKHKAVVKMRRLLDLRGNIPVFIQIVEEKPDDVHVLDDIAIETCAFFAMRTKEKVVLQRRYSRSVDKTIGVRADQTVVLGVYGSACVYPEALRRISDVDTETNKRLEFLTKNFARPTRTIAQTYKCRGQVEGYFSSGSNSPRKKSFFGTSENAVKMKIWAAISVYVFVAIVRKRLGLEASLH